MKTAVMPMVAERGNQPDAVALVSWWRQAGVDVLVHEQPQSWLQAPPSAPPPHAATAIRPVAAPSPRAAESTFDHIQTLAELEAALRRAHPRAPFADGNPHSAVMLVGAGPAADDFTTGKPFSGPAGRLLDSMLRAIGLDRSGCYIALAAPRWGRPTAPPAEAYAADAALIAAQIRLAAPRLLLLLGAGAIESLTGNTTPIGRLRGQWLTVGETPALASYNPGYLLRRPEDKRLVWADLLSFQRRLPS